MKKSRYYLILIINLFLVFSLTGCFCRQKIEVLPKSLPNASFGKLYYAEINIKGGRVDDRLFDYLIEPENSGLELLPFDLKSLGPYNHLVVKGTPKMTGTIIIKFTGATFGTMYPGSEFKKIYTIKVEE
jgi:hypothetical protein